VQIVNTVIANHDQREENSIDYLAIVRLFAAANCFPVKSISENTFTFHLEKKNRLPRQMLLKAIAAIARFIVKRGRIHRMTFSCSSMRLVYNRL
jgi:predicted RecB family endonuclease